MSCDSLQVLIFITVCFTSSWNFCSHLSVCVTHLIFLLQQKREVLLKSTLRRSRCRSRLKVRLFGLVGPDPTLISCHQRCNFITLREPVRVCRAQTGCKGPGLVLSLGLCTVIVLDLGLVLCPGPGPFRLYLQPMSKEQEAWSQACWLMSVSWSHLCFYFLSS